MSFLRISGAFCLSAIVKGRPSVKILFLQKRWKTSDYFFIRACRFKKKKIHDSLGVKRYKILTDFSAALYHLKTRLMERVGPIAGISPKFQGPAAAAAVGPRPAPQSPRRRQRGHAVQTQGTRSSVLAPPVHLTLHESGNILLVRRY